MNIKNTIKIVIVAFFLLGIIIYQQVKISRLNEDNARLTNNQYTLITNSYNRELLLKEKEFKKLYKELTEHLNKLEIKVKQVERIVKVQYLYRDTTITVLVQDTVEDVKMFTVKEDCYDIRGIIKDSLIKTELSFRDSLDVYIYRSPNKALSWWYRLWHPKDKWIYNAAVYSFCQQDTLTVKKFIRIYGR